MQSWMESPPWGPEGDSPHGRLDWWRLPPTPTGVSRLVIISHQETQANTSGGSSAPHSDPVFLPQSHLQS